jgi:hypothetical protein
MSAKIIYRDKKTEELLKKSQGAKNVYINFDMIAELPEEFECVISEVRFDTANLSSAFSPVGGGNHMPKPELMYEIAEACGISGTGFPIIEPIIEDVDINPLLGKPIGSEPTMRKMTVGRRVTKASHRMQEDGTMRTSSPCTCDYNAWERSLIQWAEKSMEYSTPEKRNLGFLKELKFAHAKAETKAYEKSIRELAALQTGYNIDDLKDGVLYFAKIRRSSMVLKLETAARLESIRNGNNEPKQITEQLFGATEPEPAATPETSAPVAPESDSVDGVEFSVEEDTPQATMNGILAQIKTKREKAIYTLKHYIGTGMILEKYKTVAASMVAWLEGHPTAETLASWTKAIGLIQAIEKDIPEQGQVTHGLYEKEIF